MLPEGARHLLLHPTHTLRQAMGREDRHTKERSSLFVYGCISLSERTVEAKRTIPKGSDFLFIHHKADTMREEW